MIKLMTVLFALSSVFSVDCGTFDASACTSNGCEWVANSKAGCSPPSAQTCSTGNTWQSCVAIAGCVWHKPTETGNCSEPDDSDCAGKDSITCGNTDGCTYHGGSTECASPPLADCLSLSETNCETESSGCKWYPASGSCKYPSVGYCEYLSETECKSAVGCEYYSQNGQCTGPTSGDCENLDESTCEPSGRGCIYEPVHYDCVSPEPSPSPCNSYKEETDCREDNDNGCNWVNPEVHAQCNRSDCGLLSPSRCRTGGSGCEFLPDEYVCSGPSYQYCSTLRSDSECTSQFCEWIWSPYTPATCQGPQDCQKELTDIDCQNVDGCSWTPENAYCSGMTNYDCSCVSEEDCSEEYSGCKWQGSCIPDSSNCTDKGYEDCTAAINSKCKWTTLPGSCNADLSLECFLNEDNTACNTTSDLGCSWHPASGVCQPKSNLNCPVATAASQCVGDGCSWKLVRRELCRVPLDFVCEINEQKDGCVDSRCEWKGYTSPGYCYGQGTSRPKCAANPAVNDCSCVNDITCDWVPVRSAGCFPDHSIICNSFSTSETCGGNVGCKWVSHDNYCQENNANIRCYDNADNTDCDQDSDLYCKWETQAAACRPNYDLSCSENPGGTCALGSRSGCKNITKPGQCAPSTGLYCVTNGGQCTGNSDRGCKWKPASAGSCTPRNDIQSACVFDAGGTECSGYSKLVGCVWETIGECKALVGSGASTILVPTMILVLLVMFI